LKEHLIEYSLGIFLFRQNEDAKGPPKMPSVTDKDYVPGRSGSPTVAEKDVLVCVGYFSIKLFVKYFYFYRGRLKEGGDYMHYSMSGCIVLDLF